MIKKIIILGSTGSIGTQALDVADHLGISVVGLSCGSQIDLFEKQIRQYKPKIVAVQNQKAASDLRVRIADMPVRVLSGTEGICELVALEDADLVLNAISGIAGLLPTLSIIQNSRTLALANKESLVTGGQLVLDALNHNKVQMIPVDSEHSAIFQCLQGSTDKKAKSIILTCSGGPFFGKSNDELARIQPADALKHPNWNMGAKITIDSATMFNKGLELIEAYWLFGVNPDDIEVVIHRESVVHSLVEFYDGSVIGQLGVPDMRLPIQYAITFPERVESSVKHLSLTDYQSLTFYKPDNDSFPGIELCRDLIKKGGILPTVMNGANEQAVSLFLQGKIRFTDIARLIHSVVYDYSWGKEYSLDAIQTADKESRLRVLDLVNSI